MKGENKKILRYFYRAALVASFFILFPVLTFAQGLDTDGDGLSDHDELNIYHTAIDNVDTDGDGYNDFDEIYNGYSPRHGDKTKMAAVDSDGDSINDAWEVRLGLNLMNRDTDGDGYFDEQEIYNGFDPLSAEPKRVDKKIKVSINNQELAYYFGETELERFPISGGLASMPTPLGNFTVLDKVLSKNYGGYGFNFSYPNTKWNLHFTTDYWRYYIHGAYWHNNFGQPMSHGCVNVRYDQMERLYNFAQIGTRIEIS